MSPQIPVLLDLPDTWQHVELMHALGYVPVTRRALAIDIGAHRGILTKKMSEHFEKVWAFEPGPLGAQIPKLKNVRVERVALGAKYGTVTMQEGLHNTGQLHVLHMGGEVMLRPLDHYELKPDFVKIDVEGMELEVLRGGEETIRTSRPVLMLEDNDLSMRYNVPRGTVRTFIESWGMVQLARFGNPRGDEDWVYGWA